MICVRCRTAPLPSRNISSANSPSLVNRINKPGSSRVPAALNPGRLGGVENHLSESTLALQKGLSLVAVQKILGHDRLSTTEIYLNLTDGHVLEEYEQKW